MREPVNDRIRLEHMLASMRVLVGNKDRYTLEQLLEDPIAYYGFVKHVEIVGEAVYKLSHEFRAMHTEVDWDIIERIRHVLVHGYYAIRPTQLWNTIHNDIPALIPFIRQYLDEETADRESFASE